MRTVLTLFGTRPEVIKLAPVMHAIAQHPGGMHSLQVSSSQHTDLLHPLTRRLDVRIDHDLAVMTAGQSLTDTLTRVMTGLAGVIAAQRPDMILVQGDTTTALAGALAGCHARIPVGHVEAGLRTGDRHSPFPEEVNRRLITQVTDLHFAATPRNVAALLREGVAPDSILLTGNTVVDALHAILDRARPEPALANLLDRLSGRRLIVLTTHRRENFGAVMHGHLRALRQFVERHDDVEVVFPVHPNPAVVAAADAELGAAPRIHRIAPLDYPEFVHLLSRAWLIVSDSGGIQEEAPSLGKPVIILRDTTERPEVIDCGIGRLAGHDGARLEALLEDAHADTALADAARTVTNPFGAGDAGRRIAHAVHAFLMRGAVVNDAAHQAAPQVASQEAQEQHP